jgi:2-oxoglutarate ferredoxin oxidoreductase subunit gamma
MIMHHHSWEELRPKMRSNATILVDTSVFRGDLAFQSGTIIGIPASEKATELGIQRSASMLALGAFAAVTGAVGLDALLEAAASALPSYRTQHIAANETALRTGHAIGVAQAQALTGAAA